MTWKGPPDDLAGADDVDGESLWELLTRGQRLWDDLVEVGSPQNAWNEIRGLTADDLRGVVLYRLWIQQVDGQKRKVPPA